MVRRVLVVDDDAMVLRGVAKVLSRAGYEVLTAVDVASALEYAEAAPIDAALVDYQLARESGMAVLSTLRQVQPRCVRILITGRSDSAVFVEAVNQGEVAKVLQKPFDGEKLLEGLDEAFHRAAFMIEVARTSGDEAAERDRQAVDEAIRPDLFAMALQPLYDMRTGTPRIFAYECLMRPKHGVLSSPYALLSAAERHERILDLGTLVLRVAGQILEQLPSVADGLPRLFVNLHPQQLADPQRLARDLSALRQPHRVTLEITEQASATRLDRWEESMKVIADGGYGTAVDDLGSGYSSLSILADLQPQFIKLDMSLVRNVHREPRKQRLVQLMTAFGEATGSLVVGEGVECEEEMQTLLDSGVPILQGFHFARPSEHYVPASRPALR
ncbi:MAG: EAL domain-containing response regulator [Alphaproteobacteria bacterium]|nr:EAL domain-containing response regulator [Alphaproteobacteria bacterium]MCB9695269.1 EAL domain-containing response regulator [Alphaproteobacteria bacterium]